MFPPLHDAEMVEIPIILSEVVGVTIKPKKRKSWTESERAIAAKAGAATCMDHLNTLVNILTAVEFIRVCASFLI